MGYVSNPYSIIVIFVTTAILWLGSSSFVLVEDSRKVEMFGFTRTTLY